MRHHIIATLLIGLALLGATLVGTLSAQDLHGADLDPSLKTARMLKGEQNAKLSKLLASVEPSEGRAISESPRYSLNRDGFLTNLGAPANGYFPVGAGDADDAEGTARAFLDEQAAVFGISSTHIGFELLKMKARDKRTYVRFQQTYDDVPVFGGEVIIQVNASGGVVYVFSDIVRDTQVLDQKVLATIPSLLSGAARETAIQLVVDEVADDLDRDALEASKGVLMLYHPSVIGNSGPTRLVWKTIVTSTEIVPGEDPVAELVFVDAHSGEVALHYSRVIHAKDREISDAAHHWDYFGTVVRREAEPPSGIGDADLGYDYYGDTYDFYFNHHGRDSIDDAGMTMRATVRYGENYQNAFWAGDLQRMVFGDGFVVDDVVGHELTHGVTDYESDLIYQNHSGAINESFSDIWGEFIDLENGAGTDTREVRWYMGEDTPFGAIRNMANPPEFGDPDRMTSPFWWTSSGDYGGVHINCGVGNKLCYLLTDGDTFNGHTVTGMGIAMVADLFYEVQTALLGSGATYSDLYEALTQATINLGWSQVDRDNLEEACQAVEIHLPVPIVDDISPGFSPPTGGKEVAISGQRFGAVRGSGNVMFDDIEAASYTGWSDEQIVCITPPHEAGWVDVRVTADNGLTSMPRSFEYLWVSGSVLFAQYDWDTYAGEWPAQNFELSLDAHDCMAADDFTVPPGQSWTITEVYAGGWNSGANIPLADIAFYADDNPGGDFPGTRIADLPAQTTYDTDGWGDLVVVLNPPVTLSSGGYWMSVAANMDLATYGQWWAGIRYEPPAGHKCAWTNPGNGFGTGATDWTPIDQFVDDGITLMFSLYGKPSMAFTSGWHMVSWPTFDPPSPVDIYGRAVSPFHTRSDNSNIYFYDEPEGSYRVPPVVELGGGYYVYSWGNGPTVPMTPVDIDWYGVLFTLSYMPTSSYPGWHLLGNTYWTNINWMQDVLLLSDVDNVYYVYHSETGWQFHNPLTPEVGGRTENIGLGEAFMVHANTPDAQIAILQPPVYPTPNWPSGGAIGPVASGLIEVEEAERDRFSPVAKPVVQREDPNAWLLQLSAVSEVAKSDLYNYVGAHREASNEYDSRDVYEWPPMDNNAVMLYFPHPDWQGNRAGNYTQDVRPAIEGQLEWLFEVKCGLTNEPIELTWPNIASIEGCSFKLVDMEKGIAFDMRAEPSYTFTYGEGLSPETVALSDAPAHRFALVVGTATAVEVASNTQIPNSFRLGQAYPNPFNPTTTIQYEVPEVSAVRIEIYDLLGQKVATLVDEMKQPGYYKVYWNGEDEAGLTVGTGIYYYRMETQGFTDAKKFLLLR